MLVISDAKLVQWRPDLNGPAPASPTWTKIQVGDLVLTNAAEAIHWTHKPAQLIVCERCGIPYCAQGNKATVTRLHDHLLITQPHSEPEPWNYERPHENETLPLLAQAKSCLIPLERWLAWSEQLPSLPAAADFTPTTRRELAFAWLDETPLGNSPMALKHWQRLVQQADCADELVTAVAKWTSWLLARSSARLSGYFAAAREVADEVAEVRLRHSAETIIFHLARLDGIWYPAIDTQIVYAPVQQSRTAK